MPAEAELELKAMIRKKEERRRKTSQSKEAIPDYSPVSLGNWLVSARLFLPDQELPYLAGLIRANAGSTDKPAIIGLGQRIP